MHVLYLNRSPVEYTKSSVCATNKESLYGGDSLVFEIVYIACMGKGKGQGKTCMYGILPSMNPGTAQELMYYSSRS